MLRASLLALVGCKSGSRRSAGCHGNEGIVLLHLAQHPVAEELLISFAGLYLRHSSVGVFHRSAAILKIERHSPMPSLLVLHGRGIAMSLLRVDMHHSRAVGVLDATEHLNKLFDVIALLQILILKSPSLKPVVLALAVALSQRTQILVYTAVVLGYRHLVVVHHNDDARAKLRSLVESLESLTARQRAVAYHGNDVLLCALHVAGLLQARGKTDGGGSVAHLKIVVLRTLRRRRISRYCIHIVYVAQESRRTSGQYLVRITLVADVENKLVLRSVEHIMQGHCSLYEAKVWSHVSAMLAHTVEHGAACLVGYCIQGLDVHAFQVGRRLYFLYIHFLFYCLLSFVTLLQSYE